MKANGCINNCTCACRILSVYRFDVIGNARNGCFSCQTVCRMRGQKYAGHSMQGRKIGRNAIGEDCHPHILTVLHRGKADFDFSR